MDVREVGTDPTGSVERALRKDRPALVGYVTAGIRPDWVDLVAAIAEAGADAVEIGLPFSDPSLDGPVIQRASDIALAAGVRTKDTLRIIEAVAKTGANVVLMTYWNPVERYGVDAFARDLAATYFNVTGADLRIGGMAVREPSAEESSRARRAKLRASGWIWKPLT